MNTKDTYHPFHVLGPLMGDVSAGVCFDQAAG